MADSALDFRSDTLTKPTAAMKQAMFEAELGDDVFGEDPTTLRLEARIAEKLGKEAALFVPSGTMSNQIGVRVHCQPGDEVLCDANCHVYTYEQGGIAQLSGAATRTVEGRFGVFEREQIEEWIRPDDPHFARTRLVCVENTHNRGGGRIWPYETVEAVAAWAREHGLAMHLDGARLFNAAVASGIPAARWAGNFDTVSVCFSKGLGAPIGSALVGSSALIARARRIRKVLGGGMRQSGVIAAAALFALEHHVDRLADDHANAGRLAEAIRAIDGLSLWPEQVDTNLVIFKIDARLGTAAEFAARLQDGGLRVLAMAKDRIRMVTHLDVDQSAVEQAAEILGEVASEAAPRSPSATSVRTYG